MTEITNVDVLVHPFYVEWNPEHAARGVLEIEKDELARIWMQTIAEIAHNPKRILVFVPLEGIKKPMKHDRLLDFAKKELGNRLFVWNAGRIKFHDREYTNLQSALTRNKFIYDKEKVRTRGLGEFTLRCVFENLTNVNISLGLRNPIPYNNPQSSILPKKSLCAGGHIDRDIIFYGYPGPLERRALLLQIKKLAKSSAAQARVAKTRFKARIRHFNQLKTMKAEEEMQRISTLRVARQRHG